MIFTVQGSSGVGSFKISGPREKRDGFENPPRERSEPREKKREGGKKERKGKGREGKGRKGKGREGRGDESMMNEYRMIRKEWVC